MRVKKSLETLKNPDVYSLLLFCLYKLRDVPDFLSLSELVYLMDRDSFLKLCTYYGGKTIQIPKIQELEDLVYALLLYQNVKVDGEDYQTALKGLGKDGSRLPKIVEMYDKLDEVLQNYSFKVRGNEDV